MPPAIAFAASQRKPVPIHEWGPTGFDDPGFIGYVDRVVDHPANNVAFQVYFDGDASIITQYPLSASEYTKDFAGYRSRSDRRPLPVTGPASLRRLLQSGASRWNGEPADTARPSPGHQGCS